MSAERAAVSVRIAATPLMRPWPEASCSRQLAWSSLEPWADGRGCGHGPGSLPFGTQLNRLASVVGDLRFGRHVIFDQDGIYDRSHFNHRLLLGLKGTMSEAELHLLRTPLIGGQLNKARRGDLWMKPTFGFVYDDSGRTVFDRDQQVQRAVRLSFDTASICSGPEGIAAYNPQNNCFRLTRNVRIPITKPIGFR